MRLTCAYCGAPSDGTYAIDRDGFAQGPEVPLCDSCACHSDPSVETIWSRIGQAETCIMCDEEIKSDDERCGSYHGWCVPEKAKTKK